MGLLSQYMCERAQGTRHAIVIDPADQSPDVAANRALAAANAGSRMILVGGSSDTDMENVHATIVSIKEALELVTWASSSGLRFGRESQPDSSCSVPSRSRCTLPRCRWNYFHDADELQGPQIPNRRTGSRSSIRQEIRNRTSSHGIPHMRAGW